MDGVKCRLMVGEAFGHKAPVETFSPMFYLDMTVKAGQRLPLPDGHREMGLYSLEGRFDVEGESYGENQFVYIGTDEAPEILAESDLRIAILGGEPFTTHRYGFWNIVSSSQERIAQAKEDWKEGRFPKVPGDEEEFIPLP